MVFDIFSERERAKRNPIPYQHEEIPERFCNQILYILEDIITISMRDNPIAFYLMYMGHPWDDIWGIYYRTKGLSPEVNRHQMAKSYCYQIITGNDIEGTFDMIEIVFRFVTEKNIPQDLLKEKIDELNNCFRKASVGYQLKNNQVIRIDSKHLHQEVVEPTLDFLQGDGFESANKEFLSALEKYRSEDYEHCITDANSAFESVMKVICTRRGWNSRGTADELAKTLSKKGVIPSYLQSYFTLGLPPLRHNQGSAHGKGDRSTEVPAYMAGYALHLAATNILFLIQRAESETNIELSR